MAFEFHNRENYKYKVDITYAKRVPSEPPTGKYTVTNLYVNPQGNKLEFEDDGTPAP